MFYLKEDDMEDLLRRAAENYEVDAGKAADWETVYTAVHENTIAHAGARKKRRRLAFWWLLLIPVGLLVYYGLYNLDKAQTANNTTQKSPGISKEKSSVPHENDQQEEKGPALNNNQAKNNAVQQSLPRQSVTVNAGITNRNNNFNSNSKRTQLVTQSNETKAKDQSTIETTVANPQALNNQQQTTNLTTEQADDKQKTGAQSTISPQNSTSILPGQNPQLPTNILANNDVKKDEPITKASSPKKEKNNTHYFYAGLAAGPDMSFVKFQKAEAMGVNVGLIAGYKFDKLSIETGLLYDKKNYYTKGEYFDKTKIGYLNNAQLLSVNGYCHMFEIPLNIKFNFSEKKNHTWFATTGLSSYLMDKEYYNYKYIANGTAHENGYPYYHASKNWFSVINLSAGYELKTGNKFMLRIEPYYKTPVSGVGTGNLSLSSAGVNIGITRRIP